MSDPQNRKPHPGEYAVRRLASGTYAYYDLDTGIVWHKDQGQLIREGA